MHRQSPAVSALCTCGLLPSIAGRTSPLTSMFTAEGISFDIDPSIPRLLGGNHWFASHAQPGQWLKTSLEGTLHLQLFCSQASC